MPKTIQELEAELEKIRNRITSTESDDTSTEDKSEDESNEDQEDETSNDNEKEDKSEDQEDGSEDKSEDDLSEEEKMKLEFKRKMDALDKKLKETQAELKKAKEKERKAEIAAMKEAGKDKEAFEAQISDLKTELDDLRNENVSLKRDSQVDAAISSIEFRSEKAKTNARREIIDSLTQDEDGNWVSKGGKTIRDFVDSYTKDEENSYLFKAKINKGSGTPSVPSDNTPPKEAPKSVFDIPQDQFINQVRKRMRSGS